MPDVLPGDNAQTVISNAGPGAEIRFRPGTHRRTSWFSPMDNQRLILDPGAIVCGARIVSGFSLVQTNVWRAAIADAAVNNHYGSIGPEGYLFPIAQYANHVFHSGEKLHTIGLRVGATTYHQQKVVMPSQGVIVPFPYEHYGPTVTSSTWAQVLDDLVSGECAIDFVNGFLYVADNPTGGVEIAASDGIVRGRNAAERQIDGVTVEGEGRIWGSRHFGLGCERRELPAGRTGF